MEQNVQQLLIKVNQSIIRIRGAYAACARQNQVNYHELLIFYSLRYLNACTQKQVCEQYLIPKQTVNNIIADLKRKGYIVLRPGKGDWREKVIELTEAGKAYSASVIDPLMEVEDATVKEIGEERLAFMTEVALHYGEILEAGLARPSQKGGPAGNAAKASAAAKP